MYFIFLTEFSNVFLLGFKSNETNCNTNPVAKLVSDEDNEKCSACTLDEIGELLSDHYCIMCECLSTLDSMLDRVSVAVERPVLPCAAQRTALQLCYTSNATQPLKCQHLVTALMECARNHAGSTHAIEKLNH
ncbi:unnamed protein product [Arctia plantaginis]|uniref:Uncharacterized protein n=1 Tax=Arctia plantaginis TaxID=874455 RepID=A0A8S0YLH9_ARCPL|nr:unnamed protein product [Arctia plantaginis]